MASNLRPLPEIDLSMALPGDSGGVRVERPLAFWKPKSGS
jgi:hypothetical protein